MRRTIGLPSCLLTTAAVVAAAGGVIASPGEAAAAQGASPISTMVITVFSEPGDLVANGGYQEFDPSNATITGSVTGGELNVTANGGMTANTYSFDIAPPRGKAFAPGEYLNVQQTPVRQAGRPGLNITTQYASCATDTGSFEVREIAYAGKALRSLDLLYEQHCNGAVGALFGEIRFGDAVSGSAFVASRSVTWPTVTPDDIGTDVLVPVRNLSARPVQVGTVTITGSDPASFVDGNDQCSGRLLAPVTGWCYVSPGFTPSGAGPQTAVINIPLGSTTDHIQLDGTVAASRFSLAMTSQPGDYIGQGQTYLYTPANATMALWGGPMGLQFAVNAGVGDSWTVDMYAATGTVLKRGVYANATRWPFSGSGIGLSVYGQGRGCNLVAGSFTVQEAVFSPVDNAPEGFAATFIQHCEGAAPALSGTITYDPRTTPAPPVTQLSAKATERGTELTWRAPSSGSAYTVVRVQPAGAHNPGPFTGTAVYSGPGTAATIGGLDKGARYLITAFTVDAWGDVGAPATVTITAV